MRHHDVAGIDYTHAFYPEMAPAHLAFALLLKGIQPPPGEGFSYAELGCGQGLTTNLLAGLHPEARFEAMDLLPSHMDKAKALATECGNANVAFHQESFADFARRDGPGFDIIALHGVWTWVDADNRAVLLDILRRRLNPGGALFLSYNCLPGWAADMPVRQLLLERVEADLGPLPERIDRALDFLGQLARQGGYFDHVPGAAALIEALRSKSDGYIAHEYLNRHWTPFYHAEVAAQMETAGLGFAASATLLDHLENWRLTPAQARLAQSETLRDTLTYTRFRRDIFTRDARFLSAEERRERLGALRFALTVPRADLPETVTTPTGEHVLDHACLTERMGDGAATLNRLADGLNFDRVLEVLAALVGLGMAAPSLKPGDAARCAAFNGAVLARNRHAADIRQLAAPNLGTGLVVDFLDRLFLLAERQGADPVAWVWEILAERGKRLRRDGRWLESAEENRAELARLHDLFMLGRRPLLARYGVGE
jgi:SAM-dependent methyltransferase